MFRRATPIKVFPPITGIRFVDLLLGFLICGTIGTAAPAISFALLQVFARYCKHSNPVVQKMSEAAFGVYILNVVVWPLFSWIFLKYVMPSIHGGVPYESLSWKVCYLGTGPCLVSSTDIGGWLVFWGWLWTFVLSNAFLWPFAYVLRKLPGFNKVL